MSIRWKGVRAGALLALLAVLVACSGGGGGKGTATSSTEAPTTTLAPTETAFHVYFLREGKLASVRRAVAPPTTEVLQAAVQALLGGPTPEEAFGGLSSPIPPGTLLLGLTVDAATSTATVNLSGGFQFIAGSPAIIAALAEVTFTVTQLPEVQAVAFQIDGVPTSTFGADAIALDHNPTRADWEVVTPPIFVESPAFNETIVSPLKLTGSANTTAGQFQVQLINPNGEIAVSETARVDAAPGTRGRFDLSFPYAAPQDGGGQLVVFELQSGAPVNRVRIPVVITKTA